MSEVAPSISKKARVSPLWIIPLVALVAGIWMVTQAYLAEGPTITVSFETADGIEAGKTKVKMLAVEVGLVEEITLKEDISGVLATIKLEKEITPFLTEETRFWVVRARVGAAGVSGIGTLLSGAYIEMSPGSSNIPQRAFVGLEKPPLTPAGAPGIRITLVSDRAVINPGAAILYRGFTAGRIESIDFDAEAGEARYSAFINAPFDDLLNTSTRFWDTSGISLNASTEGVQLNVGSLETLLSGGVAFATPPEMPPGEAVTPNTEFRLYASYDAILSNPYQYGKHYVVSFKQSMAGLVPGASVTFRGIQVGRVERILLKEAALRQDDPEGDPIPVLIYVEPGRLGVPDTPASVEQLHGSVEAAVVSRGLRASLQTANLLTGRQRIEFDYYSDDPQQTIGEFENYPTLPSIETGIARLEQQVSTLLTKLNALPLEDTVLGVNKTLGTINGAIVTFQTAADSLLKVLDNKKTQALPAELASALTELRSVLDGFSQDSEVYDNLNSTMGSLRVTLEHVNQLTRELADRPSSVLIPVKRPPDPAPKARR